jgi:tetratricopeptide (TPR) repeat protein
MRATLYFLVLLTTWLPGAAGADPFDHPWYRLATPRFEIITDLKPRKAARLAEQMEVFRISAQAFIHGHGKAADLPLKVIIFRDRNDFRSTMKAPRFSGFMQPSLRENKLIIGPQPGNRLLHEIALHEYSHYLLRNRIDVHFPIWYDEGLATFLSTMKMTKRHVFIGQAPPYDLPGAIKSNTVGLQKAVESQQAYDWAERPLNDFYVMAWALVHYTLLSHQAGGDDQRPSLNTYLGAVTPPFEATFNTSYPQLERELLGYISARNLPSVRLARPAVSLSSDNVQVLTHSERDYQLATAMMIRNPSQALTTLTTLNADGPTDVRYLIGMSQANYELHKYPESSRRAEQALRMAPGNASAQIEFASRLLHSCMLIRAPGCKEKWRRAVKLFRSGIRQDPQRFDAALGLGLSYLHSGRPGDALNYLKIAYQKAPWAPSINFYLGECYRLVGDRRAVIHLNNARNWSTRKIWQSLSDAALTELD